MLRSLVVDTKAPWRLSSTGCRADFAFGGKIVSEGKLGKRRSGRGPEEGKDVEMVFSVLRNDRGNSQKGGVMKKSGEGKEPMVEESSGEEWLRV
jgi:hypothetical protein